MTYKDFIKKGNNLRRKRDIILLSELLDLYDEYYKSKKKEPINPLYVYNETHDRLIYTDEEVQELVKQARY